MSRLRKFRIKFFLTGLSVFAACCLGALSTVAQVTGSPQIGKPLTSLGDTTHPRSKNDTIPVIVARNPGDTSEIKAIDTLPKEKVDTFSLKLSKDSLSGPVNYYAEDSVVVNIIDKKILLYGKTKIDYQDITLTAPFVELNQATQILTAVNLKDSSGKVLEEARFAQNDNKFSSDTIWFDFKTKKGLTKKTFTQQGDLFVIGETIKKVDDNTTFIRKGLFTTCDLDDPHFGFLANKIKIINKKLAVSGPTHLEFEGVPIPIYLPFGFFPLSQGRHSGLLPPRFTTTDQQGLGLEDLGYYQVLSDYWDVKFSGNVYSYGSWSANISPTYRKRYHYAGSFNLGIQVSKLNFKGDPDYLKNTGFTMSWSHAADSRARPGTSFSANVNASSTRYNEFVVNNPILNAQNIMGSSIAYSKTWVGTPFNLTLSANHSQNNQLHLVNVTLPNAGFSMATIYPFQPKDFAGTKKWYQQLGIGYNASLQNQLAFYDTAFKLRSLLDTIQWGAQHNVPITLSLPPILGGAVVVSPAISYSQVWLSRKTLVNWNDVERKLDTTVSKGFFVDQQATFSLGFSTAIYGTYHFKSAHILGLRHVIRPTFGINYKPDFSKNYYYNMQVDTSGYKVRFNEFVGSLYSGYGEGRTGGISFGLDNSLEMKVRTKKDSANGSHKLSLIDGLGFSGSYNFLQDSLKLSHIGLYFRTNLFQKINLSAQADLDPYQADSHGRDINTYMWEGGKFSPGRITSGSVSLSTHFESKPTDPTKDAQKKDAMKEQLASDPTLAADQQRLLDYMRQNPSEFVDFNIPWSINLSYSLNFYSTVKPDYSGFTRTVNSNINFTGTFNLTPKWNFSVNGFYDMNTLKMQIFTMAISRDMHCWQMSINVTPVGIYSRSFSFTISPKAGILQDLKINRTRTFNTGNYY